MKAASPVPTKPVSAAWMGTATAAQGPSAMGPAVVRPSLPWTPWGHRMGTPQIRFSSKSKGLPSCESPWLSIAAFILEVLQQDPHWFL